MNETETTECAVCDKPLGGPGKSMGFEFCDHEVCSAACREAHEKTSVAKHELNDANELLSRLGDAWSEAVSRLAEVSPKIKNAALDEMKGTWDSRVTRLFEDDVRHARENQ